MKADGHTGKDIAKYLGVSRATLYRYLSYEVVTERWASTP
jgi:response regulator of citrate/malate metabolism